MHKKFSLCLLGLISLFSLHLHANPAITVDDVFVRVNDRIVTVDCDFTFEVDEKVENALSNGVEVAFMVDIELVEENLYWMNQSQGRFNYLFFIKYHALSQQYILKSEEGEESFPDLYSAFYFQSRIKNITLANIDSLDLEKQYFIRARARLASEMLPLPLRIKSYFSNEWRPSSGWTKWPM